MLHYENLPVANWILGIWNFWCWTQSKIYHKFQLYRTKHRLTEWRSAPRWLLPKMIGSKHRPGGFTSPCTGGKLAQFKPAWKKTSILSHEIQNLSPKQLCKASANGLYFIKLDILVMPLGQSRSGYGLNFSGLILMICFVWNLFYKAILLIKYRASTYCYMPAWHKMTLHTCSCDVPENPEAPYNFYNYPSTVWCSPNKNYILLTFIWWNFCCFLPLCRTHTYIQWELCVLIPLTMSTLVLLLPVWLCVNAILV